MKYLKSNELQRLIFIVMLFILFPMSLNSSFYRAKTQEDLKILLESLKYAYKNNDSEFSSYYTIWRLEYLYYASKTHSDDFLFLLKKACSYQEIKYKSVGDRDLMLGDTLFALSKCYQMESNYNKAMSLVNLAIKIDQIKLDQHIKGEIEEDSLFLKKDRIEKSLVEYEIQKAILLNLQGEKLEGNKIIIDLLNKIGYTHNNGAVDLKKEILFYLVITKQDENFIRLLESASQDHYLRCRAIWPSLYSFLDFIDNILIEDIVNKYPKRINNLKMSHIEYGNKDLEYARKPESGKLIPGRQFPECTKPN